MSRLISVYSKATGVNAVEIPEDVDKELSELADHLTAHPEQAAHAVFDTAGEAEAFTEQARYWAVTNSLTFRKVRSKGLPANEVKFSLKAPEAEDATV